MAQASSTAEPTADRWGYLERPAEQYRYAVMASLLHSHAGPGRVAELGAGRGHLLAWLDPRQVTAYEAIDIDAGLLAGLRHVSIAIARQHLSVEAYAPERGQLAGLVAAEVLYYVEEPGHHLLRIWRAAGAIDVALVSSVLPRPDKPNWRRGYDRVRGALAHTGWPILDTVRIESAADGLAWEVVALRPGVA
jgi:hypothetical protein